MKRYDHTAAERTLGYVLEGGPPLDPEAIADLLSDSRVTDAEGLGPDDEGYTPTWSYVSLCGAASRGWNWKAAKAAGDFDFSADGQSFNRSQVVAHCRKMADYYGFAVVGVGGGRDAAGG